jgi:hypothetical protein
VKTGDKRHLDKWAEFVDDRSMNWRADCAAAGYVPICWNDVESYTRGFFPNLAYLARTVPNFGKDLPPATLARELLPRWRSATATCSNSSS